MAAPITWAFAAEYPAPVASDEGLPSGPSTASWRGKSVFADFQERGLLAAHQEGKLLRGADQIRQTVRGAPSGMLDRLARTALLVGFLTRPAADRVPDLSRVEYP